MRGAMGIVKWVVGAVILLAVIGGGAAAVLWPMVKKQMEASRGGGVGQLVRLEPVEVGDLVRTVSAPGLVEAARRVSISARISAQIEDLPFEEGDTIRRGDMILKLDDRDLQAQLASVEASLRAEEARLEGARATYINAVSEWERQSALYESNDVPKSALDQAEAERRRAEANMRAAEASIEMARASISRVREDLRYTQIASPINGTLTRLNAEVGEIVMTGTMNNPGTVIMEIADLSEMIVRVEVDETDIAHVRVGQRARVYLNAYPDEEFEGVVRKIALERRRAGGRSGISVGASNDVFEVEVVLDLRGRSIYSGLTASVDIEIETLRDVMLVPSQAVLDVRVDELPDELRDNPNVLRDRTFARVVYLIENGEAKARPVSVGPSDLRTTALLAGVEAGERVIVGPYKALLSMSNGVRVRDGDAATPAQKDADGDAVETARADDEPPGDDDEPAEQSAAR